MAGNADFVAGAALCEPRSAGTLVPALSLALNRLLKSALGWLTKGMLCFQWHFLL